MLSSVYFGQTQDETYEFLYVDEIPKFDYKGIELSEYLYENIEYLKKFDIEGRVIASFVIDEKGKVCDVEVIKSITEICSDAVVKVLSSMPKWKPGKVNGKPVRVRLYITIVFRLL